MNDNVKRAFGNFIQCYTIKKAINKRTQYNTGFVIYSCTDEKFCCFNLGEINELYEEIKKDFPTIPPEAVEVRISRPEEDNCFGVLEMIFWTDKLPEKSKKFEEINSFVD